MAYRIATSLHDVEDFSGFCFFKAVLALGLVPPKVFELILRVAYLALHGLDAAFVFMVAGDIGFEAPIIVHSGEGEELGEFDGRVPKGGQELVGEGW